MKFKKLVMPDRNYINKEQEQEIRKLADTVILFDDIPKTEKEIVERIGDADVILTSWIDIGRGVFQSCPNLKYVGIMATGYSWIDTKAAKEKWIAVTNVPGYATESVAEMVFCQLLSLTRNSREADRFLRDTGRFERELFLGEELTGKTIGIIGLGKIGSRVAEIGKAFGMNVVYHSRKKKDVPYEFFSSLDDMIPKCDVISIHSSSSDEFLNAGRLAKLHDEAIVINFGVAGCVNEEALAKELRSGRLKAALDHFVDHKVRDEFKDSKNVILSPEIGYYTKQSIARLADVAIDNAKSFLEGNVKNRVNW
jgi:lactate dehydrogenase-like 2-hydroxyacid dehydrogenase